jgi:hypothetical protein
MPARYWLFSSAVSTSRTTVKTPIKKTAGNTMATKTANTSGDCAMKPIATSELDSENT